MAIALFFLATGTLVTGIRPGPSLLPTRGAVWPYPAKITQSPTLLQVSAQRFSFNVTGYHCDILWRGISRYKNILHEEWKSSYNGVAEHREAQSALKLDDYQLLESLDVHLSNPCQSVPHRDMNESYELKVMKHETKLEAPQIWGILRGLETFVHLIYKLPTQSNKLVVNLTLVEDWPRFSHRGLMLDTSRHFLPVDLIYTMLDAMAANKLNVFHWHIVDDQSFPYQSQVFPQLSDKGAYHPSLVYTAKNVRDIVEYARLRGIRVIPEFDTPGHTRSWGEGMPELLTKCYNLPDDYGPIDPSKPKTYKKLRTLFEEILHLFPDNNIHLGGDEVDYKCWQSNPNITELMKREQLKSYQEVEGYHIAQLLKMMEDAKGGSLVWQEVFLHGVTLSNHTIVHLWTGDMRHLLRQVTQSGHDTILSTCWYLDHFDRSLYAGGGDWKRMYACDPHSFNGTPEQKKRVLGGEACMWGEYVDETNIVARVWPRASAASERLWSPQQVQDPNIAAPRLEEHTCRMRRRGIRAQPPNGPSFCT